MPPDQPVDESVDESVDAPGGESRGVQGGATAEQHPHRDDHGWPAPPSDVLRPPQRAPQPGSLSLPWRVIAAATWIAVTVALGAVWKTSDQLGLATWWTGPRGNPHSLLVQLLPFVAPVAMVLVALNDVRRHAALGLAAAATIVAVGLVDLGYVVRIGVVEIGVGVAAGAMSLASGAGTYRARPGAADAT